MVKQNEDGNTDSNTNWSLLLKEALTLINDVPQFPFLYGAFDPAHTPEPKQRKQRVREPQEKHTKKQLERVQIVSKEEEGIEDTVNFLERVLKQEYESNGKNPISYMRFIVDSDDFSATVENNFYSAFLIRDGKAKLSFGMKACYNVLLLTICMCLQIKGNLLSKWTKIGI